MESPMRLRLLTALIAAFGAAAAAHVAFAAPREERAAVVQIPDALRAAAREVTGAVMERVYDEVKTPYKYGIVLRPAGGGEPRLPQRVSPRRAGGTCSTSASRTRSATRPAWP